MAAFHCVIVARLLLIIQFAFPLLRRWLLPLIVACCIATAAVLLVLPPVVIAFFRTVVPVCTELVTRLVVPKRSVHSPTGPSKPRELRPRPLHMRIRPLHMRAQGRVWVFPKTPAKSQFDTLTNWQCRISIAPDRTVTRQSDQCVACLEDRPKTEMSGTGRYTPPKWNQHQNHPQYMHILTVPQMAVVFGTHPILSTLIHMLTQSKPSPSRAPVSQGVSIVDS